MLEKLRNRRIAFVGDSLARNQLESLLCMLSPAVSNKSGIYEVNGQSVSKHRRTLVFKFKDYNCTVEHYWTPFLVRERAAPKSGPPEVKMTLNLDKLVWTSFQWKHVDVLVINTGHWWGYEKTIKM